MELVERKSLHHFQIVADGIIIPGLGFQTNTRQQGFQFFLIDGLGSPLLTCASGESIELLKDVFHIATPLEVHIQVTGTHVCLGGICRSGKTYIKILGLERTLGCFHIRICKRGIDFVFLNKVAHKSHIQRMRSAERHFHQLHHLPIKLGYLHRKMRRHIVGLQLGIETGIHFHGRVASFERSIKLMVFQRSDKIITGQAVSRVMHLIHRPLDIEMRFGSKEIQSFTVGMKVHGHLIERILRKKLMNVKVVHHKVSQISILRHVVLGINSGGTTHLEVLGKGKRIIMDSDLGTVYQCLGSCFGLFEQEIQNHFRSCHGKDSVQRCTTADGKLSVSERTEETHVVSLGRKVDFTSPSGTIRQVKQIAFRLYVESIRQNNKTK